MKRYILRWKGSEAAPAQDIQSLRANPSVRILDITARMLLVEADEAVLSQLQQSLPDWIISADQTIPIPDTRKKINKK